jgi:hypothetical protein
LPKHQQIIQSAHSALEAGRHLEKPDTISHLVLLPASDESELLRISQYLDKRGIKFHLFFEPADNMGHTSLTTEPIVQSKKKIFQNFTLYKGD